MEIFKTAWSKTFWIIFYSLIQWKLVFRNNISVSSHFIQYFSSNIFHFKPRDQLVPILHVSQMFILWIYSFVIIWVIQIVWWYCSSLFGGQEETHRTQTSKNLQCFSGYKHKLSKVCETTYFDLKLKGRAEEVMMSPVQSKPWQQLVTRTTMLAHSALFIRPRLSCGSANLTKIWENSVK